MSKIHPPKEGTMATAAKIPMLRWTHPQWDGHLITPPDWTPETLKAHGYLNCEHEDVLLDPAMLEQKAIRMTWKQIDALPEWDG
jgi:hypothetical protein